MKMEIHGTTLDLSPEQGAFETRVVRALRKNGPLRQKDVWFRAAGHLVGRDEFTRIIDEMVERETIVREPTNCKNAWILRMPKDKRRRDRALARDQQARQVQITEPAPLTPEAA